MSVRSVNERQVSENRNLGAEGVVQVNLTRGVINVIGAANDVTDFHIPIIDHNGKVIGRNAVAHDD